MPQIANTMEAVKNAVITIGTDTYEKHASDINWTRNSSQQSWQGLTDDVVTDSLVDSHTCNIGVGHDYDNPDSLYNFLHAMEGLTASVTWKPSPSSTFTVTATITIVAPTIGGPRGFHSSTVACPSTKPVVTPPV